MGLTVADEIDAITQALPDWRGQTLRRMRALILAALPDVEEKIQWRKPSNPAGIPTWSQNGLICTGETYKDKVKFTFMKGGLVADPTGIFTGGFGGTRRVIDLRDGDSVDEKAFVALMQCAAATNGSP